MLICASVLWGPRLSAAERPDFSGTYTLKAKDNHTRGTLRVAQTDNAVEIARVTDGEPSTYQLRLDGTEAPYVSPGGARGTCAARLKGKSLLLDMTVTARPQANGPVVQMRTRERWSLSSDAKTLTIRNDVDFPNMPLDGFQVVKPWSDIYTRD